MNDSRKLRDTLVSVWQSQMVSKHVAGRPVEILIWDVEGSTRAVHRKMLRGGAALESEEEAGLSGQNGKGNGAERVVLSRELGPPDCRDPDILVEDLVWGERHLVRKLHVPSNMLVLAENQVSSGPKAGGGNVS